MAAQTMENGVGAPAVVNGITVQWRASDLTGRTVLITGGAEGIGKETALDLARRKARVLITCRSLSKGKTAADEIIAVTGNQNVYCKALELCSFKSVKALAEDVLKSEPRLDILICNAGAFFDQRTLTEDHIESTFSTNYLGHFLLTLQLLPMLKKSPSSRIVLLSSHLYLGGFIDFENLNAEKWFSRYPMYCNSKLALMLFGRELGRRLKGSSVRVYMCDPGLVKTKMITGIWLRISNVFPKLFKTPEEGARTSIYAAVCSDLENDSGNYYANSAERSVSPQACNDAVARKLWSISEKLCGTVYE